MTRSMQLILLLVIGFFLIFGAFAFSIYKQHNQNEAHRQDIEKMRTEVLAFEAKTASRAQKEVLQSEIEKVFGEVVDILPLYSPEQEDLILDALTAYSSLHTLQFRGIVVTERSVGATPKNPKKPAFGENFQQVELAVRYQGTFFNFLKFLSEVERHPTFLSVDQVVLKPTARAVEPKVLDITIKLSTFHYAVKP